MFGLRRRVKALESELKWKSDDLNDLHKKYWALQNDVEKLCSHFGVYFENVHKRVLVKKGGPEKGD
jgi:hypothetical protein